MIRNRRFHHRKFGFLRNLLALAFLVAFPAQATSTRNAPVLVAAPVPHVAKPRPRNAVRVFQRSKPREAFVIVDRITVTPSDTARANELFHRVTDQELLDALREEAGRMGADGVIDLAYADLVTSTSKERAHLTGEEREQVNRLRRILTGTVVRFNRDEVGVGTRKGVHLYFSNEMPPFDFDEMTSITVDASDIPGRSSFLNFSAVSRKDLLGALLHRASNENAFALVGVEVVDIGRTYEQVQIDKTELSLGRRHFHFREGNTKTTETKAERRVARGIVIRRR